MTIVTKLKESTDSLLILKAYDSVNAVRLKPKLALKTRLLRSLAYVRRKPGYVICRLKLSFIFSNSYLSTFQDIFRLSAMSRLDPWLFCSEIRPKYFGTLMSRLGRPEVNQSWLVRGTVVYPLPRDDGRDALPRTLRCALCSLSHLIAE